jgi:hypothetical protein
VATAGVAIKSEEMWKHRKSKKTNRKDAKAQRKTESEVLCAFVVNASFCVPAPL